MIEARGLRKTFADGTVALRGVDLTIERGVFGLLGPNGAGKTTLMSILVLALEPTGGTLRFDGRDAAQPPVRSAVRATLGFLPQAFMPLHQLSGREYLAHCLRLRQPAAGHREAGRRVAEALAAVDLTAAADRTAATYSGGMRRRLGLAQALIHRPEILVIDEPTAGLDPEERIRLRNLIADVGVSATVVLSTHIVEDIEATCARIAVVAGGLRLYDGTPSELLRRFVGRLWTAPEALPLPAGALDLGERAGTAAGHPSRHRLFAMPAVAAEVAGAAPHLPNLELAYLSFLAEREAVI